MARNKIYRGHVLSISLGIIMMVFLLASGAIAATPISSCGPISSPGSYMLNQNIIDSSASKCIEITSNDIVFDGAGYTIDGVDTFGTYGVYVYNSTIALTNVTVKNVKVTDWYQGFVYYNVSNGRIANNIASRNDFNGISLYISTSNAINGNTANLNNHSGISLDSKSNFNNLSRNSANSNKGYGIYLVFSSNNTLTSNNASNNFDGIILVASSSNNTLISNNASNNVNGIYLNSSSNKNLVYNNYFNNPNNAFDNGNNTWNISKTPGKNIIGGSWLGGNFWSDYAGSDLDGDGLGDTLLPYNSSGNIEIGGDYLPLTKIKSTPVPALTPIGLIAITGLLSVIGINKIRKREEY